MSKGTIERKVRPLGDRVLVRMSEPVFKVGSIILPDNAKEKPTTGEVLALGETCESRAEKLVGHVVIFHNYSGSLVPGSKDLMLIREQDLLGVQE